MRLNFSNVTPDRLRTGIQRLGGLIDQWGPLHGLACGLALKIGVERLGKIVQPRKAKTTVPA
jgi:hypothetical protein